MTHDQKYRDSSFPQTIQRRLLRARVTAVCSVVGLFVLAVMAMPNTASSQQDPPAVQPSFEQLNPFDSVPGLPAAGGDPVALKADFQVTADGKTGRLRITAEVEPGWHLYSVTQAPGGPTRTTIKMVKTGLVRLTGSFFPNVQPTPKSDEAYPGLLIEEHAGIVTWTAKIDFPKPVEQIEKLTIPVVVDGLVCQELCQPFGGPLTATYAGIFKSVEPTAVYEPESGHAKIHSVVSARSDGDFWKVTWQLHVDPADDFHVYAHGIRSKGQFSSPTTIVFDTPADWVVSTPRASSDAIEKETGLPADPIMHYHDTPVTWTVEMVVPKASWSASNQFKGQIGYQLCTDLQCDPPDVLQFSVDLPGEAEVIAQTPVELALASGMSYDKLTDTASQRALLVGAAPESGSAGKSLQIESIEVTDESQNYSLGWILIIAAFGGFLLNFMPCVLPVIGLKIMAFVSQAGADRKRVFLLNVWYSVGMLVVFMVLATLLSAKELGLMDSQFGWGQQSQYPAYTITVTAVIFVMALSFLGIWEIPVPGFVGSSKMAQYSEQKEGYQAAFSKGIITTLVAIPCTAPALSTALVWCANKPPSLVYTVFVAMGLGMAAPYLVIGLYPQLVSFLPKPGGWMETFKQFLGFMLLGTVVFFLSFLESYLVVPTISFLIALWMACWILGMITLSASTKKKWVMRGMAVGLSVAGGYFSFAMFDQIMADRFDRAIEKELMVRGANTTQVARPIEGHENELPWQIFSEQRLLDELAKGNTVMVDFTADW